MAEPGAGSDPARPGSSGRGAALRDLTLLRLLEQALELAPEAREAWLTGLSDPDREPLLRRLLARHDDGTELEALVPADGLPRAPLAAGQRLGAFTVESLLGEGGMGRVYLATQDHPRRQVALKVLHRASGRFRAEAAVLARLRHPHIAQVHASGELPTSVDSPPGQTGTPWLAMELVDGARPFLQWVREDRPPLPRLLHVFVGLCEAVHHAHQRGVIHRDLKSANVLIDAEGQPKVIDFGVARLADGGQAVPGRDGGPGEPDSEPDSETDSEQADAGAIARWTATVTRAGDLIGSPVCMAPEQVRGDPAEVDTRADVHALGALLYTAVCGRPPRDLEGLGWSERLAAIVEQPPRPPGPEVDADLSAVLLEALQPDRERRYPSALALAADLQRWARHEPVAARPPGPWRSLILLARRRPGTLALTGALLAALLGALIYALAAAERADRARLTAEDARAEAEEQTRLADDQRRLAEEQTRLAEQRHAEAEQARLDERAQRERAEALTADLADTNIAFVRETAQTFGQLVGATEIKARFVERAVTDLARLRLEQPRRRLAAAHARLLLGDVLGRPTVANLGRRDEALTQYDAARQTATELAADPDVAEESRALLALVAVRVGDLALTEGRLPEALALYESVRETLARSDALAPRTLIETIQSLVSIGTAHGLAGDFERAADCFDQGERLVQELLAKEPRLAPAWLQAGHVAAKQAATWLRLGDTAAAERDYQASLAAYERALEITPPATSPRWSAAQSRIALAEVLIVAGRPAEALPVAEEAAATLEWLARIDPANAGYTHNLCDARYNRAWALHELALRADRTADERRDGLRAAEGLLVALAQQLDDLALPPPMARAPAIVAQRLARVRNQLAESAP